MDFPIGVLEKLTRLVAVLWVALVVPAGVRVARWKAIEYAIDVCKVSLVLPEEMSKRIHLAFEGKSSRTSPHWR